MNTVMSSIQENVENCLESWVAESQNCLILGDLMHYDELLIEVLILFYTFLKMPNHVSICLDFSITRISTNDILYRIK